MKENFLNLIYPNVCGICDKVCIDSLCKRCELILDTYKRECIKDCRHIKNLHFDYCINILKYESIIREKIIQYKFNEKTYLYKTFSKIMEKDEKICRFLKEHCDIIIPVPMHKDKQKIRGYNQTELVAKEIAGLLKKKIDTKTLLKVKNNQTQSTLTKSQRIENVRGVFEVSNPSNIKNKRIVLFDDIYTTGNTLNECSKILKKAGAKSVIAVTLAKD